MKAREIIKNSKLFVLSLIGVAALSSCLKDGDQTPTQVAAVAALNAVPESAGLDIFLNQNQLNFPQIGENFRFGDSIPYKNAYPGSRLVRVFDRTRTPQTAPYIQQNVTFEPGKFYTLYVVADPANYAVGGPATTNLELVKTEDDLSRPEDGSVKIRFINLSPTAPKLSLKITQDNTPVIAEEKEFKAHSAFVAVPESTSDYTFEIIDSTTGEILRSFDFKPLNRMIYTVWAKGLYNATPAAGAHALDYDIIKH